MPALWIFLLPAIALAFFLHAQNSFDNEIRAVMLEQVRADRDLSDQERSQAMEFVTQVRPSDLAADPRAASMFPSQTLTHYAIFRWMIRLSVLSIAAGVLVFVLGGSCVLMSLRSQWVQYLSLSAGWHLLRLYCSWRCPSG